jgi:CelD/BcsL family acetyltransferase involved in cellulose biosynthesis
LEDSSIFASLQSHSPSQVISIPSSHCDYLLCEPLEEIQGRLSKNFRHNLRKARTKLETLPNVEWVTARSPDELKRAFVDFLTVEASGWKGAAGTAIHTNERARLFYEMLIDTLASQNICEINLLKTNGRTIAGQFCLVTGATSYILKIGYDEDFSPVAPGQMLLVQTVDRYARDGNVKFINLITDAEWHERWKPHQLSVWEVSIFNVTPLGLAVFGLMKARATYQTAVPEHIRRQIRSLWRSS